jgi:hypothetical protein
MIDTAELIRRITEYINSQPDDISKKELKKAISDIYDELTKTVKKTKKSAKAASSDSDSDEKPEKKKRALTKYNAFIKEQMAVLKQNETPETKMNAKEKMLHISKLWQEAKEAKNDEVVEEADGEAGEADGDKKPKNKASSVGKKSNDEAVEEAGGEVGEADGDKKPKDKASRGVKKGK